MRFFLKIKAGAIQYVLVISVIIIILLFAFLSLVFTQKKMQLKSSLYKEAIHATQMGFTFLSMVNIPYYQENMMKFTSHDFENTTLMKKPWGMYDVGIVQSSLQKESFQKVGLLGNKNKQSQALYLQENHQALVLVGTTKIIGDVTLPKRGVKKGMISGTPYYGSKLVYGNMTTNAKKLPNIHNLNYLQQLVKEFPIEFTERISLEHDTQINQSFTENTLVFETQGNIELRDVVLYGNIVIISSDKITITDSSTLENVILIAPVVTVAPNVTGSFQVFATKRIHLKAGAQLKYPSSLVLIKDKEETTAATEFEGIKIDDKASLEGVVLYHSEEQKSTYKTQVLIEDKAHVLGEVYCNKNLELRGRIDGFVYANNFIAKQFGGVYMNHLYNAEIDATSISENYCGLSIGTENKQVAKWIE